MVDFFASRPMEDFFINPTVVDDCRLFPLANPTPATVTDMDPSAQQYRAALRDYHHERRSSYTTETALTQFALPPKSSFVAKRDGGYWRDYTSEEEQPSPPDYSRSSSVSDLAASVASDLSFPDYLASSYSAVEQQCSQARVVQIRPAGRARMISLPKLITTASAVSGPAEQYEEGRRPSIQRMQRIGEGRYARNSHDSTSSRSSDTSSTRDSPTSVTSTAPSSIDEPIEKTMPRQRKPVSRHVPLMEAARALTPVTPHFPAAANDIRRGSVPLNTVSVPPPSNAQPQLRRMSKFGLNRAFTMGKSSVSKDEARDKEVVKESAPSLLGLSPAQPQHPSRYGSLNKNKLVARGADERAPPVILPPSPLSH